MCGARSRSPLLRGGGGGGAIIRELRHFGEMACPAPSGNGDKNTPYETDFVERPLTELQSECSICLQTLREPRLTDCCGHSFCAACINGVERRGKPCPLCNKPGFTTVANLRLKRDLNESRVYCPHRHIGCEWIGKLGKRDEHLNSDPQPERRLEGCQFAVIECLHCKEGICRDEIAGHQLERCPQRPYTCECCLEYNSTFEDVVHSHPAECKCFLLPCPNKCTSSESGIQRQYLDQHVKNECLLTVVQCELHHAGCEVTLPRKDMTDHMKKDSIAHISLLAAGNHRLSKQLGEKEEQICLLTQWRHDLKKEVISQSTELTRTKQELMYKEEQICLLTQATTELEENTTDQLQDLRENVVSQSQELTRTKQKLFQTKQGCLIVVTVAILLVAILLVYHVLQQRNLQELRIHVEILQTQQQHDLQELRTDVEILQIQLKCDLQDLGMDVDILQTQRERDLKELRTDVAMLQTQNERDLKELRKDVAMLQTQRERDLKELRTDVASSR